MWLHLTKLLVVLLFSLTACAPIPQQIKLPPERSFHRGFSLVPPNETGWFIHQQDYNTLALSKHGTRPNESYVILTSIIGLPHLDSQDDFINEVTKIERDNLDLSRFKILYQKVEPYPSKADCVRTNTEAEDHAAVQQAGGVKLMVLEVIGLFCKHPAQEETAIYVGYSHRHFSGYRDPALSDKAEKLFESFEFNDLN